jgi:carboxy-terminal domain RNA polymerase II polypeptide A small phosphatase
MNFNADTTQSTGGSSGSGGTATSSSIQADFMTQTDAYGNSLRRPDPTHDFDSTGSSSTDKLTNTRPNRRFLFQRWFCCFVGSRPDDFADEIDESAHQNPVKNPSSVAMTKVGGADSSSNGGKNKQQAGRQGGPSRSLPQKLPVMEPPSGNNVGKKCLVLDLDETLVHSSLREEASAHMVIPVNIDNAIHNVFVIKRPGVDMFLKRMGEFYEIIIYTASLSKYADPLLDRLDTNGVISKRLFRENCVYHDGHFVKDLSLLNRDLKDCIIVDNSPMSYTFHPENAIDCGSFIDDPADVEMWMIGDFLAGIHECADVRHFCRHWREWCKSNPSTVPRDKL